MTVTLTESEAAFDRELRTLLHKYPTLREEILRSVVHDEREAMLARNMVDFSQMDDTDQLWEDANGLG